MQAPFKIYSFDPKSLNLEPNPRFKAYVDQNRSIAADAGFDWNIPLDQSGVALSGTAWDLRSMAKDGRPTPVVLRTFSHVQRALDILHTKSSKPYAASVGPVSLDWQDLIKAHAIEHVLIRKKGINYISAAAASLRILATVSGKQPWQVTADDIQLACQISDELQPSGGTSIVLRGIISGVIDPLHLFDACPLSALVSRPVFAERGRAKFAKVEAKQAKSLSDRKSEEKLPDRKAFWEIIRIVFTEHPKTLNDALRFAMIKVLLMTGLRVNEVALLPQDWRRTRSYVDQHGKPAGEVGGISEALLLRHFAEKQDNTRLYESTQFVPLLFQREMASTLAEVERLTRPFRRTLKAQYETGRIFPMYEPDQLVDSVEMYCRLSGNAVWAEAPLPYGVAECLERYTKSLDDSEFLEIARLQASATTLTAAISRYFSPLRREQGLVPRLPNGDLVQIRGVKGTFLRVSEVESYVRKHLPTKLSDLAPLTLDNGAVIAPWEMLFLMPKRAVGAGRGQTVIDPHQTFSVGIVDSGLLHVALGADSQQDRSLFQIYGQTDEDRRLTLKTHSFRHLQNTELFRLGVADTIITKRFNRRSVAQSYEYDHRSLAEELDQISLPEEWELMIGESKAATVAKLIAAGRANGPIVREFKHIQALEGDAAALQFLAAEADGFHATPYGTCLNSFTVDPCPQHLECFTGCRHLSATNLPEHQRNILTLHGRLKVALELAIAKPEGAVGKANQISHVTARIKGVERLMETLPGNKVFPNGRDISMADQRRSVLDGA
jgi:hypothetical protein